MEEAECELSPGEKSPLAKTISGSSLYRRKSTRGSSFAASEGEKESKEKVKDEIEEVSCDATSLGLGQLDLHGLCRLSSLLTLSDPYTLQRERNQGPFSPLLFVLAIGPLAIAMRGLNHGIKEGRGSTRSCYMLMMYYYMCQIMPYQYQILRLF